MQITLQNILPVFFKNKNVTGSQVWNKTIVFNKGEHVHIVAPSGSGKTSLIHFLYGLRKDYTGQIVFNNDNLPAFVFYMNDQHIYLINDKQIRQSLLKASDNTDIISLLAKEREVQIKER